MNLELGKVILVLLFAVAPIVGIVLAIGAPGLRARGPLFVAFFAGLIPILAMYIPKKFLSGDQGMSPRLDSWLIIVAGFALLLGVVNVIQNGTRKVARREPGWPYAVVLLTGLFITGGIGIWSTIIGEGITSRPDGSATPFQWIANNMFQPLQSTIFALLAFFMASAAFRAFRARNTEATILLLAGILVMAGRVPLLEFLAAPFPPLQPTAAAASQGLGKLTEWIMNTPNGAAQSGIIIGAALGAAAMAIRVILGIERGYLGLGEGSSMAGLAEKLLSLDRRWLFLLVLLGVAIPIVMPIGLPVTTTGPTRSAYEFVEALPPGSVVLLSFDYGPSSAPENDPMADGFLRQCFMKKLPVIVCALYPLGGLTLANNSLARVTAEFPGLAYGVDYVNLGYKDGAAAVLRSLDKDFAGSFPADTRGTPIAQIPIMKGVHSVRDVKVVYSVATGIIGEWWITQMHPQSGTPVIVGPTAVGAPKYYAYLNAGQLVGMVGGMKGAAEYEKLLAASHPQLAEFYRSTRGFTATKGMDGQTVIHAVIILFILIGNLAYMQTKKKAKA